jgi:hypothetical protein
MGRERMPGGGVRNYDNIGRSEIEMMLGALTSHGFTITGQNPWHVDTHQHGVRLKGEWDEDASTLALSVTDRNWYVTHAMVWDHIDSLMREIRKPDTA